MSARFVYRRGAVNAAWIRRIRWEAEGGPAIEFADGSQEPIESCTANILDADLLAIESHVIPAAPGHVLLLYAACVGQHPGLERLPIIAWMIERAPRSPNGEPAVLPITAAGIADANTPWAVKPPATERVVDRYGEMWETTQAWLASRREAGGPTAVKAPPGLPWAWLTAREPELLVLEEAVRAVRDDPRNSSFCATQPWYGWHDGDEVFVQGAGLLGWLDTLVGARREWAGCSDFGMARNPALRSLAAYNAAYKHLQDLLPKCRNCRCPPWPPEETP